MNGENIELTIEIKYGNEIYTTNPSTEFIPLEQIIEQSCKRFNIDNELKPFISLTYKDEQGDINIIENEDDLIDIAKEINPDKYKSFIFLDICPYEKKEEGKNEIIDDDSINEDKIKKNLEEENQKLKLKIIEKDKKIKNLEKIIEKMKKDGDNKKTEHEKKINWNQDYNLKKEIENDIKDSFKNEIIKIENITKEIYSQKNNIEKEIQKIKNEIISIIKEQLEKEKKNDGINGIINNINTNVINNSNLLNEIKNQLLLNKENNEKKNLQYNNKGNKDNNIEINENIETDNNKKDIEKCHIFSGFKLINCLLRKLSKKV